MAQSLKITLKRSLIGQVPRNRRTARALGLKKLNKTVVQPDTPPIRGMVRAIRHMVEVEEVNA